MADRAHWMSTDWPQLITTNHSKSRSLLCQPRRNKDTGLALASMLMSGVWIAAMCSYAFSRRRGHRDERAHDQQSEQLSIVSDSFRYLLMIMSYGLPIVPRAGRYVPIVCREFTDSRTHMSKCVQYKVCTLVKQMCQIVQ